MRTQGGKNNTPYVQIGLVVSADPVTIKIGDLQIGKDNLLVADHILPGYERKTTGGDITFTDGLKSNDIVALIPTLDEQTYIVLARVVSL